MNQVLLPGDPPIEIALRRSGAARRIGLRVSRLDGRVTLTLPRAVALAEGMEFARSKEDWLRRMLARQVQPNRVGIGAVIPVEGRPMELAQGTGRSLKVEDVRLLVPGDPARAGARVAAWLKVLARERLAAACDHYARQLGVGYSGLTLRDTRSRWGSCAPDGRLMFSWRLILAPPEVLDYVAAHEVAHRIEMNHSPAYWAVVARIYPGHRAPRDWLKREGQSLHSWQFGAVS